MREKQYHIGPGAVSLLLLIVVVSMSVLGLLSLISARSDYKFTERSAALAVAENTAAAEAQASLAALDEVLLSCAKDAEDDAAYLAAVEANLPEGMRINGRSVEWEQGSDPGRTLYCGVEILPPGSDARFEWRSHMFIAGGSLSDF